MPIGDPAGIGPEIAAKATAEFVAEEGERIRIRVVGPASAWETWRTRDVGVAFEPVGRYDVVRDGVGRPSAASGKSALAALHRAIDLALAGEVDGVVTAPVSKEALVAAGDRGLGQTEILVARAGVERGVMLFVGGGLRVALATRHVALARVATQLNSADIAADLGILARALRLDFGLAAPRIAVTGVNPHAGEGGLFGDEEREIVRPAIDRVRAAGHDVTGPLPADTAFVRHRAEEFDAVLAMYHDQGLIPVKLLAFGGGVNVTLGLPFVRTSPDHGTAFDLAGRGRADPSSMLEALRLAAAVVRNRRAAG